MECMWYPDLVTSFLHTLILCFSLSLSLALSLSLSLSLILLIPSVHSCTTQTHFFSQILYHHCGSSVFHSVFLLLQFFCAEGYSSFFYKLFLSFTISIIHLHTPSFLIIFFAILFIIICTCPFPSISLWTLSSFHPGLISTSLPVCSFIFMLFL